MKKQYLDIIKKGGDEYRDNIEECIEFVKSPEFVDYYRKLRQIPSVNEMFNTVKWMKNADEYSDIIVELFLIMEDNSDHEVDVKWLLAIVNSIVPEGHRDEADKILQNIVNKHYDELASHKPIKPKKKKKDLREPMEFKFNAPEAFVGMYVSGKLVDIPQDRRKDYRELMCVAPITYKQPVIGNIAFRQMNISEELKKHYNFNIHKEEEYNLNSAGALINILYNEVLLDIFAEWGANVDDIQFNEIELPDRYYDEYDFGFRIDTLYPGNYIEMYVNSVPTPDSEFILVNNICLRLNAIGNFS